MSILPPALQNSPYGKLLGKIPGLGGPGSMAARVQPWMPASANSPGAASALGGINRQIGQLAKNPYGGIPEGILYGAKEGVENQYQGARAATQSAGLNAGIGGSGVQKGILGNLELGRGAGMADATRAWDDLRTKIGDERIANLLLPFLSEQYGMHNLANQAILGQPKKQGDPNRAGNLMSGLLSAGMTYWGNRNGGQPDPWHNETPPGQGEGIGAIPR